MGNLPFYIVEHKRVRVPVSEMKTLFANAEFEFIDMAETKNVKKGKSARARLCTEKDFDNNDSTKRYFEANKDFVLLCPSQDDLFIMNS